LLEAVVVQRLLPLLEQVDLVGAEQLFLETIRQLLEQQIVVVVVVDLVAAMVEIQGQVVLEYSS
jgi:hypothetical protein